MKITKIGEAALDILAGSPRGSVHSVYKNTVNLTFGGELLAIHALGTAMTPIALQSDIPASILGELFETGDRAAACPGSVTVGEVSISIPSSAEIYRGRLTDDLNPLPQNRLISILEKELSALGTQSVFSGRESSDKLLSFTADTAAGILKRGELDPLVLPELIGLGPGLTPAGDDFLIGTLAALEVYENESLRSVLESKIADSLSKTADISAAFLKAAINRRYSQHLLAFLERPSAETLSLAASSGHSSGADTLYGILFTLKYII